MNPTITQNSALYLVQRKISERRSALFARLRIAGRNQQDDLRRRSFQQWLPYLHADNGR
jgi:hypothetical protein